ncbi:MAG: O-antigen ligase family protein [Pseudomonadota bacterium]
MNEVSGPKVSYPAILAGLFILWPIVAYLGGQGFTAGVALAAIPVLFYARPKSISLYALAFICFMLWIIASASWSGAERDLFEGSLGGRDFGLNDASLRVGLTALCIGGVAFIATQVNPNAPKSLSIIRGVIAVQIAGVVATALFMDQIIQGLVWLAWSDDPAESMPSNMMRNANAMMLILPVLTAWLWTREGLIHRGAALALVPLAGWAGLVIGSWAAIAAVVLIGAASLIVWLMKRAGFLILFTFLGSYILIAPFILGDMVRILRDAGVPLPASFWSRLHAWDAVTDKVAAAPMIGHGLEASKTWTEAYGQQPAKVAEIVADTGMSESVWQFYSIVPGHPHNMALQIWAETGMVGALLAALTCFLVGVRLYQIGPLSHMARFAGAGLFGATLAFATFSYSMWNEAFWASVALVAAVVILHGQFTAKS